MNFGKYYLGQYFWDIKNELTEVSTWEYELLKPSFKDEKIYNGTDVFVFKYYWKSVLGITDGKVYKISLQKEFDNPLSGEVFNEIFIKEISTNYHIARHITKNTTIWNTEFGNIVLTNHLIPELNIPVLTITRTSS